MLEDNVLLRRLFGFYKKKDYISIHKTFHYINVFSYCKNRYRVNNSTLDAYIIRHTQADIQDTIKLFYALVRIYRFVIKKKYTPTTDKQIINDTTLYGDPIKDCKELLIYLNTDTTTYNSNKYYAFPYSELNKIITHALLFTFDDTHIISSQYPKHPLTNKKLTLVELEYILYQFKYHSLSYHKVVRMFQDANFSLNEFNNIYGGEYMFILSSELYVKQLTSDEFKKLFQTFWRFISFEYTHSHNNVDNRIGNKVCKHCIVAIPDLQTFLQPLLSKYHLYMQNSMLISKRLYANSAILFKNMFLDRLSAYYPHVFKNKSYHHLHYNKYRTMTNMYALKNKHMFMGIINLPIVSFTDDCKIIYNYNGQHCVRDNQTLVTI